MNAADSHERSGTALAQPPYTYAPSSLTGAERTLFLLSMEDDTEEAPWMVMGDRQFWSATDFASMLHAYAQAHHLPWYVAGMLPILYPRSAHPGRGRKGQVAPDVMVALVPQRARQSYDLETEGVFPVFVLEVLSPSSVERDQEDKTALYELLGAQEYALFAPEVAPGTPTLQGYRRGAAGLFEDWQPDEAGRLWSERLGLYLVADGTTLRAVQRNGQPLLRLAESEVARQRAEEARLQETVARQRAEEELAQLRAQVERDRDKR